MKQTAAEWLIKEIECRGLMTKGLRLSFNQAKQIEKEQIMMSYHDGRLCIRPLEMSIEEQYYKQNFGEENE